ncbi:acyl-CoA thioesterase [Aliiglaciecola lipolytica]|uniref:Acyl-CoA thioester hydrolase n=1 Tax=Aliiglaciecola lipolytica E3 TaxID=1127673 RepID=K6X2K8_9ALTE|nr:thioesterase family protein [Aliiglaciecola lipolytica]GAC14859.1 acyl-CoA thioester hydrolase [Aliiglaciecola lipolytica E3]
MSDSMKVLFRVRYAECDAQQVVFNSRYAEYVDLGATEFMRGVLGGFNHLIEQGFDNQVVNLNISWQGPAKFDDVIEMAIWVSKVGTCSYTLSLEMRHHLTKKAICLAEVIYVMVDAKTYKKVEINEQLKQKLLAGAPTLTVNLAGTD